MKLMTGLHAVVLLAGSALAQPPRETPPGDGPPPGERPRDTVLDPEALRTRLERRLAESQRTQDQLQTAIARLREGKSPAEAMQGLDLLSRGMGWGERGDGPGVRRPEGDFDPIGRDAQPQGPKGDGPGARRGDGPRGGNLPMTDDVREWATAFLRANLPTIATRLDAMRETDPAIADAMLGRLVPKLRDAERVREHDPDLAALRLDELRTGINTLEAIRVFRKARELPASDAGREARVAEATKGLRATLAEQHEVRLRLQAHEITSLAARLESLRAELERKRAAGDAGIDEMLRRVTEFKEPGLGQGESPDGRPGRPRRPE